MDIALNETCRIISGCLKPTPVACLYALVGICPPHIRRDAEARRQRIIMEVDNRHPLYGRSPVQKRLRSRKSFLHTVDTFSIGASRRWKEEWDSNPSHIKWETHGMEAKDEMAPGRDLRWTIWKTINRLRVGVGRCRASMHSWGLVTDPLCRCGDNETMEHTFACPLAPACKPTDLAKPRETAILAATYWSHL